MTTRAHGVIMESCSGRTGKWRKHHEHNNPRGSRATQRAHILRHLRNSMGGVALLQHAVVCNVAHATHTTQHGPGLRNNPGAIEVHTAPSALRTGHIDCNRAAPP